MQRLPQMLALLERLVRHRQRLLRQDWQASARSGAVLAKELERTGFAVTHHAMPDHGDQLDALLRRSGGGAASSSSATWTTVWPEGTTRDWRFTRSRATRPRGTRCGRHEGAASVTALFALRELLAAGFDALESIRFFLVPEEELGSIHSRQRIEAVARGRRIGPWCWSLRVPAAALVTARGAVGAFFMHAHGQSAHCATNYLQRRERGA